jgi:hypothetical protein
MMDLRSLRFVLVYVSESYVHFCPLLSFDTVG